VKSTHSDVQNFDAAFSVIDREVAKIIAAIKAVRPAGGTTPPKRPHSRPTTRKAA